MIAVYVAVHPVRPVEIRTTDRPDLLVHIRFQLGLCRLAQVATPDDLAGWVDRDAADKPLALNRAAMDMLVELNGQTDPDTVIGMLYVTGYAEGRAVGLTPAQVVRVQAAAEQVGATAGQPGGYRRWLQ